MQSQDGMWMIGDLDAAAHVNEPVTEFMGFPWSVWVPEVRVTCCHPILLPSALVNEPVTQLEVCALSVQVRIQIRM